VFLNIPTQGSELSGLIPNYLELLLNSTRQIVNVIRMSLCTSGSPHPGNDQTILLDPYPEHVSDSLWYAGRGILTLARERILSLIAVESMLSVVLCGLSHLTKISFSARERLPLLRQLCVASGYEATINNVLPCFSADTSAPSSTSQSAWVDGAERLTNESLCDATLVTNTIYGYDNRVGLNQRALGWASDEVDWSQIDSVLEQWKFSVRSLWFPISLCLPTVANGIRFSGLFCRYGLVAWRIGVNYEYVCTHVGRFQPENTLHNWDAQSS
jgi:hypothetical protein